MANEIATKATDMVRVVYGTDGMGALAKVTPSGEIVSLRKKVKLSIEDGQYYEMQVPDPTRKDEDRFAKITKNVITAKGYDYIRSLMGIHIMCPDTVIDDNGNTVGNPQLFEEGGMLKQVRVRSIACCRGPSGNWQAQDLTFVYSFAAYLADDLYAKWYGKEKWYKGRKVEDRKQAEWGKLVNTTVASPCSPDKIRVSVSNNIALECDLSHSDVFAIIREHLTRQKFAERNAHSMCARNLIRKLTGLYYADEKGMVEITVWIQKDKDHKTIRDMISRSKDGAVNIEGDVVIVERTNETVVELDEDCYEEADEGGVVDVEPVELAPTLPPPPDPSARTKIAAVNELRELLKGLDKKHNNPQMKEILKKRNMTIVDVTKDSVSLVELDAIISEVKEILK